MKISTRTTYSITVGGSRDRSYSVVTLSGQTHFIQPDSKSGLKLYLVGLDGRLHYVGITNRPMSARINMGIKAKGKNGYHGYAWKNIRAPMILDVITLSGNNIGRSDVEAIEAEVAYLCRSQTGEWPLSQTEIHFRRSNNIHKKLALEIYRLSVGHRDG